MNTRCPAKPFTTKDVRVIKQMYEEGSSYKEIAEALGRSIGSVMATTNRLIRSKQIKSLRCKSVMQLGGLEAAQAALNKAICKGYKYINYTTSKGKNSHVLRANLEKQIARYMAANDD
ncbi:sigma factor-like helix-turn-helix DNA-binding protein [Acinetobacter haemolyticus]|uniref:sigma factor-like helix-turn-helix DNA-binding protein n=1 Tax=Acinetobacter haemolyticus TaxID=29430 RepID=UPI0021CD7A79|nr:sigma factor-like helix-turn-helix DNA-binding protein [Acinetobacter haemolyticus]MCU4378246.1 hypothetical protein [Acinetobacter haemolyticus]WPO67590.1 sigma factor-like helix-turn-helix DNA-binding protein [Acinetobacter haemolyticus]